MAEVTISAWCVPVGRAGDRDLYAPGPDRIQFPDRAAFSSAEGFYASRAHEAIYSTGHDSRLQRDLGGRMGCPRCASDLADHSAYLEHWIASLRESPRGRAAGRPGGDGRTPQLWLPLAPDVLNTGLRYAVVVVAEVQESPGRPQVDHDRLNLLNAGHPHDAPTVSWGGQHGRNLDAEGRDVTDRCS